MNGEMQEDVWKTEDEWFRPWFNSPAYHLLYGHRSEEEAQRLVASLMASGALGTPLRTLDAGCGSGRHARALAKHGWEVDAFDLSPESIQQAHAQPRDSIQYHVKDLRNLGEETSWQGQFHLVTNFFTSMGYFRDPADQEAVVKGLANVLHSDGTLILDYLNVEQVAKNLVPKETMVCGETTFDIHRRIHNGWIEKSIRFEWEGRDEHHVERVQALSQGDFEVILRKEGLEVVHVWGDYELNKWTPTSSRCLMAVRFPKS